MIHKYTSASVALSLAGLLNGFDTGCIGSIVHMDQFAATMGHLSATITGITVSVIMLTGVVPALFGGYIADRRGRLRVIIPGAALFGLGAVLQATAFGLGQFIAGRAISGTGQGVFLANVSVYITEIAPHDRRGKLAALPQFMSAFGVCAGYFTCYGTVSFDTSLAWRIPYIPQVVFSALLCGACFVLPESPRWLLQHGKTQEAIRALERLDFDMDEARRDLFSDVQQRPSLPALQSFRMLFGPAYRQRTFLALFVMSMTQLSGIDAITYVSHLQLRNPENSRDGSLTPEPQYAPALFKQAGISGASTSLVASGVASITMLLVSIPGFILADKWGRRTSAISGGVCLSGLMVLIGSLYAADAVTAGGAARWVVVVSVFLFGMVFCATWAIFGKIYASEIQPGNTRAAGNSVGMAFSFVSDTAKRAILLNFQFISAW